MTFLIDVSTPKISINLFTLFANHRATSYSPVLTHQCLVMIKPAISSLQNSRHTHSHTHTGSTVCRSEVCVVTCWGQECKECFVSIEIHSKWLRGHIYFCEQPLRAGMTSEEAGGEKLSSHCKRPAARLVGTEVSVCTVRWMLNAECFHDRTPGCTPLLTHSTRKVRYNVLNIIRLMTGYITPQKIYCWLVENWLKMCFPVELRYSNNGLVSIKRG